MTVNELITILEGFRENEEITVYDNASGEESEISLVNDHWFSGGVTIHINAKDSE
jgi:hypothetical protein